MRNALIAALVGCLFAGLYYGIGVILSWMAPIPPLEGALWASGVHAAWRSLNRLEGEP